MWQNAEIFNVAKSGTCYLSLDSKRLIDIAGRGGPFFWNLDVSDLHTSTPSGLPNRFHFLENF
jgi:hypothetical protein